MASDAAADEILERARAFAEGWQNTATVLEAAQGCTPKAADTPGPSLLVLNLGHLAVPSTVATLDGSNEDAIKAHPGVRATFAVVRIITPGWSSVCSDADSASAAAGKKDAPRGGNNNKRPNSSAAAEPKQKLSAADGTNLRMYSYDLVNKKGTYLRCGRSAGFASIMPGMILSLKIWGNKFRQTFAAQADDIPPFSFAVVQLGMKSMQSTAVTSGLMLEIKTMQAAPGLSLSALRLLRAEVFPRSIIEATTQRERMVEPAVEEAVETPDQSLIKGNVCTGMQLLCVRPQPCNGVFAVGPDARLRMHITQPIADVAAGSVNVRCDAEAHGCTAPGAEDWMAKFLNVATVLGAVELFLLIDSYRAKDVPPADLVLEGYARVDVAMVLKHLLATQPARFQPDAFPEQAFPPTAARHVAIFNGCVPDLDLAVDTRRMTKRPGVTVGDEAAATDPREPVATILHPSGRWQRANLVNIYYQRRPVLSMMVPTLESLGSAVDRAKRALVPVAVIHELPDATFDEDDEPPSTERSAAVLPPPSTPPCEPAASDPPPPPKKKSKTAAAE